MNPDGTYGDVPTAADFFAGIVSAPPRPPDDVLEAVHCLKIPRRPRRCHELQVLLARLFGPNMPKPLFRIVVEFWLGRGLPYKYSRDYLPEPEEDFPSRPGNGLARFYIREGL